VRAQTAEEQLRALEEGRAYVEIDDVSVTEVSGGGARAWLHDLVTTDVESIGRLEARPCLLLTPTGRIRASFHVVGLADDAFALLQRLDQPRRLGELFAPYVLSADVEIRPLPVRILALPGREAAEAAPAEPSAPSILGGGLDLLVRGGEHATDEARRRLADEGLSSVRAEVAEARRIRRGEPRFPVDVGVEGLPAEAGWDVAPTTDRAKGCFLGQESVARVASLGHPPHLVVAVEADEPVRAGEAVVASGRPAGSVTSADGRLGLARIRWDAREDRLATVAGVALRRR
jgi:folate-binding protein YgfZ